MVPSRVNEFAPYVTPVTLAPGEPTTVVVVVETATIKIRSVLLITVCDQVSVGLATGAE
jgi:hypothetical protein